jgi:hypothetical protein
MNDHFDELEQFETDKGLYIAWELTQRFRRALANKDFFTPVRTLSDNDFAEFRQRFEGVFDRLESVGYTCTLLTSELESYKAFMARVYSPEQPYFQRHRHGGHVDLITTAIDARTVRYSLEAFLFLVASFLEYLSQAIGFTFKRRTDRHLSDLVEALEHIAHRSQEASFVVAILESHRLLWQEIQEKGFRSRFSNVDVGSGSYKHATLRDIAAHYRALRLSGLQMTISRGGRALSHYTLEPGAQLYENKEAFRGWGEGKGIASNCEAIRDELRQMTFELLNVFIKGD